MAATRRLAAIMFTDLVGFTSSTHRDEPRTMRLLADHRKGVRAALLRFGGREVKTLGDGFLAEFGSALDAMLCALDLQRQSVEWISDSKEERPQLRIAVHVGDVLSEEGDILGDAVNVASRIESLVEPGGILVSGAVFDQVHNKVLSRFEKLPPTRLRGVTVPLEIYRAVAVPVGSDPGDRSMPPARIAVLPFASISPDARDEYLADGLTEELISTLSLLGGLRVISRTSVDVYKNRPKPVPQIGAELGVRSLLEGSVRRVGNRVRVTAQLIDVSTQEHLWSGSFDRELDDVFTIQGEIAREVAENLEVTILDQEKRRLRLRPTGITESYLAYLRGRTLLKSTTLEGSVEARREFELSVRLDPNNARGYSGLADAVYRNAQMSGRSVRHFAETLQIARGFASRSILLDPTAAEAHVSLGFLLIELLEFSEADRELRTAISLNPSYAVAHLQYARLLTEKGRLEEAFEETRIAEAADPLSPSIQSLLTALLLALGRQREAEVKMQRLAELEPDGLLYHLAQFESALRSGNFERLDVETKWITGHAPVFGSEHLRAHWNGKYRAAIGDVEGARREMARLKALRDPETGESSEWAPGEIAEICALLNETDECFLWLDQAFALLAIPLAHWWLSSSFQAIRNDPRFRETLKRAKLL